MGLNAGIRLIRDNFPRTKNLLRAARIDAFTELKKLIEAQFALVGGGAGPGIH